EDARPAACRPRAGGKPMSAAPEALVRFDRQSRHQSIVDAFPRGRLDLSESRCLRRIVSKLRNQFDGFRVVDWVESMSSDFKCDGDADEGFDKARIGRAVDLSGWQMHSIDPYPAPAGSTALSARNATLRGEL